MSLVLTNRYYSKFNERFPMTWRRRVRALLSRSARPNRHPPRASARTTTLPVRAYIDIGRAAESWSKRFRAW